MPAICPKCHRENKTVAMEIEGTRLKCPSCGFTRDFPQRMPTPQEAMKIIRDKEKTIAELEEEVTRLNRHINWLEYGNDID